MQTNHSSNLLTSVRFRGKGFQTTNLPPDSTTATSNQEGLAGFSQEALRKAKIFFVGAGGIVGNLLISLVRKGLGWAGVADRDDVEIGNLDRQHFFPEDIGQNKAICLSRHAIRHASWPCEIAAYPMWAQDAIAKGLVPKPSAVIDGPDNDKTRVAISRHFHNICPIIHVGIGLKADHFYVFLETPNGPCFGCLFPGATKTGRRPCPGVPQLLDLLLIANGYTMVALDSVLMARPINWNYYDCHPNGSIPTRPIMIERRKDCAICGQKS